MQKITNLDEILCNYDAIFSDIWGVIHNSVTPFKASVKALKAARAKGVKVILITNAPSSASQVINHLKNVIQAEDGFYDDIITSGDVAAAIIKKWTANGQKCFHLGLRDSDTEAVQPDFSELVDLDKADYVLCTFLAEKNEVDLQDYLPLLTQMKQKNLPFLCSNPDNVVDVGGTLYYCAGALAALYKQLGGEVIYTGKPHSQIYQIALDKLAKLLPETKIDPKKILVIGDGLATDVPGANKLGADMLFVADGIHAREFEQSEKHTGGDVFSDDFTNFIEQQIKLKGVDVKYYLAQLK
ncbi:MAG: TIGR01459 family HAD-type hydrolase [Rhizobiales bacterium]|nr:TIGR01459 family HAD-type hydrolase [Hyphomicrobiales bacterium]NRB13552.1 TIGR01459 family HAD-type hydrolase [Hyphomicrobiales bacterium]